MDALNQLKRDMTMLTEDISKGHNPYSFPLDGEWQEDYVELRKKVEDAVEHIISFTTLLKKKMGSVLSSNESNTNILQLFVEEFEQRGYALDKYEMKALLAMVLQLTETVLFTEEKDEEE